MRKRARLGRGRRRRVGDDMMMRQWGRGSGMSMSKVRLEGVRSKAHGVRRSKTTVYRRRIASGREGARITNSLILHTLAHGVITPPTGPEDGDCFPSCTVCKI